MAFLRHSAFCVLLVALCAQQIICAPKECVNQQISQDVNGPSKGCINQVISQDVENAQSCHKSSGSVNQNINQDVVNTCGGNAESINQKIHQKVKHGSTCIDQKTFREIKNHEKRCSKPCCAKEIIFKRKHSNNGGWNCGNEESSEEIKICDAKHSSEIIYKNHADKCGDLSEDSSEEIRVKYEGCNKCNRKPCECQTSEEILMPKPCCLPIPISKPCRKQYSYVPPCAESKHYDSSEEIVVYKPHHNQRPCKDSSEEVITIKTKNPCHLKKTCSSEEHRYPCAPKPCAKPCKAEEYVKCFKPCPHPKPCDICFEETRRPKPCSSEEFKPCPCGPKPCTSEEFKPCPCGPKPCSSEEFKPCPCGPKPCSSEEFKPCPCGPKPCSSEEFKPCPCGPKPCSSEEFKPCPCRPKPCSCQPKPWFHHSSEEHKPCPCERKPCSSEGIIVRPCPRPLLRTPCRSEEVCKPKPCDESSEEIVRPCFRPVPCFKPKPCPCEVVVKPRPCGYKSSEEVVKPWGPYDSWQSSGSNHEAKAVPCARRW